MEEYKKVNGETLSLNFSIEGNCWEVTNFDEFDNCR
jgi:hypothetical protein